MRRNFLVTFCVLVAMLCRSVEGPPSADSQPNEATTSAAPPETRVETVSDTYHGVAVTDDYRWLESWDDAVVQDWTAQQNGYARGYLDALPGIDTLYGEVDAILNGELTSYFDVSHANGQVFAQKYAPRAQQPCRGLRRFS
jgi:protease II